MGNNLRIADGEFQNKREKMNQNLYEIPEKIPKE
jgi:hypothetical protein